MGCRPHRKALLDVAHDRPLQVAPLLFDDPYGIPGRLGVEARMNAQGSAGGTLGAYRGAQHFLLVGVHGEAQPHLADDAGANASGYPLLDVADDSPAECVDVQFIDMGRVVFMGVIAGAHDDVYPGGPGDLLEPARIPAHADGGLVDQAAAAVASEQLRPRR